MAAPSRIGRYEIKTSLGKGGMGSLYIARDPNTGRLVAVKLLSAHLDSEELKVRFEVEAKALAQLNHPNIVDIYDSGQFRGSPFIVMEYVRGETLDEMIRRSAPLSQSLKLKLIAQLCAGLAHAHDAGVIHRDIKPANLMVEDRSQRLKIVDFGIARVTEGLTRIGKMTRLNVQIGTPGYMSPEQVEGEALDHRSDVFAVGVVLYELLTNTTAFPGNNTRQIEKKVLEEQPPALNTVVPDLDPAVQAIVDRALQKDPAQRYQSASEFAEALDSVHERLGKGVNEMRGNVRPSPVTPGKLSPAPVAKGSRADVAFQRSQCAYTDGAVEAAKRFAVEALVEDAGHEAARAFLKKVDPQRWVPPPPPKHGTVPPTQVARPPGSRGTELADDSGYDATIVSPRPAVGNWDSSSSDAGSQEWDPFGRTVVVRPGQGVGGAPWPGGDTSEDSGELVDRTVFVPQHEEPGGWPSSRTDADPYDRTIIAPPSPQRKSRRDAGRAQPSPKRRPFPWAAVAWSAGAVVVVALAAAATWLLLLREEEGVRLTIEKPEGGTITMGQLVCGSGGNDCTGTFELEALLEFEAKPDEGFRFTGFTGDCAPGGRTRMTGPRSCAATFEKIPEAPKTPKAKLTVSRTTGGTVVGSGIKCGTQGGDCSVEYDVGTVVTLTVLADEGYTFRGFMGDCGTGRTFSAAISRPLDCGIRVSGPPLKTAGGEPASSPTANPSAGSPPDNRVARGPGSGGTPGGTDTGGTTTGSKPGPGVPPETSERVGGGRVEKVTPVKPPITAEEHAKEMEDLAKKDIEKTLGAWPTAYANLDFPAIQRLFPTAPNIIQTYFRQYDALDYSYAGKFDFKQLDWAAGRAVVVVDVKQVTTPKVGKKQQVEQVVTFELYKREDSWLIGKFNVAPKRK